MINKKIARLHKLALKETQRLIARDVCGGPRSAAVARDKFEEALALKETQRLIAHHNKPKNA